MILRIIKSTIFRIKQTSLLLIVMFVMSFLLCISFSINNASNLLINQIKNSTNALVSIDTNFSDSFNRMLWNYDFDDYQKISESIYADLLEIDEKFKPKYMDINLRYSNYGSLKPYSENYGILMSVSGNELEEIKNGKSVEETLPKYMESFDRFLDGKFVYWNTNHLISTRQANFADIYYGFSIGGHSDKSTVVLGRTFSQDEIDNGEYVCVITPDTYYYKDGELTKVEVGDYIEYSVIKPIDGEIVTYKTYEFRVIGMLNIGKTVSKTVLQEADAVIIPEKAFLEIYEESKEIDKEYSLGYNEYLYYYPCIITMNNFDDAEKLVEYLNDLNSLYDKEYKYETSLDSYYSIAGNLESLSENSKIIYEFSIIVAILLFILMINMDLNRRKKEIGLLSTFGLNKPKLILEFIIQYLIIAFVALILAIIFSYFVTNTYINNLLNIENISTTFSNNKILDYSSSISIIKYSKANIDYKDILKISLLEFIVIIVVTTLSMLRILSIKVREVLIDE